MKIGPRRTQRIGLGVDFSHFSPCCHFSLPVLMKIVLIGQAVHHTIIIKFFRDSSLCYVILHFGFCFFSSSRLFFLLLPLHFTFHLNSSRFSLHSHFLPIFLLSLIPTIFLSFSFLFPPHFLLRLCLSLPSLIESGGGGEAEPQNMCT